MRKLNVLPLLLCLTACEEGWLGTGLDPGKSPDMGEERPPPDPNGPIVQFEQPAAGQVLTGKVDFVVKATGRDATIEKMGCYALGETPFTSPSGASPLRFTWDTTKQRNGTQELICEARDSLGRYGNILLTVVIANCYTRVDVSSGKMCGPASGTLGQPPSRAQGGPGCPQDPDYIPLPGRGKCGANVSCADLFDATKLMPEFCGGDSTQCHPAKRTCEP